MNIQFTDGEKSLIELYTNIITSITISLHQIITKQSDEIKKLKAEINRLKKIK